MYKKQKPVPQKTIEPTLNDRIIQLQNEAAAVSCEYKLDDYDIAELVFERYCDKFPDFHYIDIQKMIRVQRSDGKEFLIYYTAEEVTDNIQFKRIPFNRKRVGFHARVTGLPEYDNYGTLTGYDIGTPTTVFDIPFDPQGIKKLIASARSGPREVIIGKAAAVGEHPMLGTYYTCPNLENWLYGDLDMLISAQKLGYLKSDPSGFEEYLNIRAKNLHHGDTTTTKNDSEKSKELSELSLPSNSNEVKLDYSVPITEINFDNTRLGAKSTEKRQASEHELLDYRRRLNRAESALTPQEIKTLVYETNQRRTALEESIRQQKREYMQRHDLEVQTRRNKQGEEDRQLRIKNENEEQRRKRLEVEEQVNTSRAKEIQALVNKCRKEKEEVETFFLQSSNRFNEKYLSLTKKVSGETGIDRIVSSRTFSTNRYAHRCIVCGYHNPESLSISKIYKHVYENKDQHMQFTLSKIDGYYNTQIADTRRKHAAEDNPDLKQQKLSKDLEALRKLRGAKYR